MSRLFKIHEEDLVELEKAIPQLSESFMMHLTPATRTTLRRCKNILSDIRWHYGPPSEVGRVPASE